jgi:hypothetical protein
MDHNFVHLKFTDPRFEGYALPVDAARDLAQKVISVKSMEVVKNYQLTIQFDELTQLKDGWYEGEGVAPDSNKLKTIAQKLTDSYPEHLPLPTVIPTQDGNLLLEWDTAGDPSVDIDLSDMRANFHAFGANGEDIEADFTLNGENDYKIFFEFLSFNVQAKLV